MKRPLAIVALLALLGAVLSVTSCTDTFVEARRDRTLAVAQDPGGLRVRFSGVSTLLISDGDTQIVIDGYYSRQPHYAVRRIAPDPTQIANARAVLGLEAFHCAGAPGQAVANCDALAQRGLALVIPAHAHYDHAMDSAIIAAMTGARLIADRSVRHTLAASRAYVEVPGLALNWDAVDQVEPFETADQRVRRFHTGAFTVTLIRTPHFDSPITRLGPPTTPDSLTFPTRIFGVGEGTSLSIHIRHGAQSLLILPSAGDVGPALAEAAQQVDLAADVVFYGIGGFGWKPRDERDRTIRAVLRQTRARRIIPVHWDYDGAPLFDTPDPGAPRTLSPLVLDRLDAVLRSFETIDIAPRPEVAFAPVVHPFDPFQGL
jgi:L-ascorbate metabolism protein UlaG (beta-lactamase superfamily)